MGTYPASSSGNSRADRSGVSESVSETTLVGGRPGDTKRDFSIAAAESTEFLKTLLLPPKRPGDLGCLGDYRVSAVLGTGGMGVVLAAHDPVLRRAIAIKLVRPEVAHAPRAKERFLREARSAAAVDHPRVVVIYQVGEWNGIPFLVMPLLAGLSLGARLKQEPAIPLCDAVRFVRETADGLAAAHARGVIHRDIKPDNIWLEQAADGTHVRLLDFGLARGDSEILTEPGRLVGTPFYMAPEQAEGQPVDGRSDLFSLGCVLYELVAGRKAFSGSTLIAVLNALANHHPPRLQEVSPSVPAPLSQLTMRLLEKSPARRPASAADLSAELRSIEAGLTGATIPKPQQPAMARPGFWKRLWAAAETVFGQ